MWLISVFCVRAGRCTGPAFLGSLLWRYDIDLPVNTAEYVQTRMAMAPQVEAR